MSPRGHSSDIFESAKTTVAIPITVPLVREALIQFTLDPAVRAIEIAPRDAARSEAARHGAIVLVGETTRELLDFPELVPTRDIDETARSLLERAENLAIRRITAAELRREPRASNCKMVWTCRNRRVIVDDRIRLLDLLDEEGPQPLSRAAAEMRFARGAISAVLAMACADLIEIELADAPLGPKTIVRRRRLVFGKE
jgi:hypothetical protein